jgi:hypothetical protein
MTYIHSFSLYKHLHQKKGLIFKRYLPIVYRLELSREKGTTLANHRLTQGQGPIIDNGHRSHLGTNRSEQRKMTNLPVKSPP